MRSTSFNILSSALQDVRDMVLSISLSGILDSKTGLLSPSKEVLIVVLVLVIVIVVMAVSSTIAGAA
jgi:hypothetical protein